MDSGPQTRTKDHPNTPWCTLKKPPTTPTTPTDRFILPVWHCLHHVLRGCSHPIGIQSYLLKRYDWTLAPTPVPPSQRVLGTLGSDSKQSIHISAQITQLLPPRPLRDISSARSPGSPRPRRSGTKGKQAPECLPIHVQNPCLAELQCHRRPTTGRGWQKHRGHHGWPAAR